MEEKKIIVLTGTSVCGKSTLAQAIADKIGKNYHWYWTGRCRMPHIPKDAAALIIEGVEADFFRAGPVNQLKIGGSVVRPVEKYRTAEEIEYRNFPQLIVTMNYSLPANLDPGILRRLDVTTMHRSF